MVTFYKEKAYAAYLAEQKVLTELSQETYLKVVRDFFSFIETAGSGYQDVQTIDNVTEHEIRLYLNHLVRLREDGGRGFSYNTRVRYLSVLRSYFEFLMKQRYITELPTLGLKLEKVKETVDTQPVTFQWLSELPGILKKEHLSMETRFALLLLSKRVTIAQMTTSGFYLQLKTILFTPEEQKFVDSYFQYIKEKQQQFTSSDLFFKEAMRKNKKGDTQFLLSRTALNKILSREQAKIGFPVKPTQLIREATLAYLQENKALSDAVLLDKLNITYPYLKNLQKQLIVNG